MPFGLGTGFGIGVELPLSELELELNCKNGIDPSSAWWTAATVSAELYLDMHHCGLWVTSNNVEITPLNYSTFDALLHCVK